MAAEHARAPSGVPALRISSSTCAMKSGELGTDAPWCASRTTSPERCQIVVVSPAVLSV